MTDRQHLDPWRGRLGPLIPRADAYDVAAGRFLAGESVLIVAASQHMAGVELALLMEQRQLAMLPGATLSRAGGHSLLTTTYHGRVVALGAGRVDAVRGHSFDVVIFAPELVSLELMDVVVPCTLTSRRPAFIELSA